MRSPIQEALVRSAIGRLDKKKNLDPDVQTLIDYAERHLAAADEKDAVKNFLSGLGLATKEDVRQMIEEVVDGKLK